MTDAAKEARRTYCRNWQRENRDKVKKYQESYWERQVLRIREMKEAQERATKSK